MNGELVISYYGSDEVEDKMFQSVLWEQDGCDLPYQRL